MSNYNGRTSVYKGSNFQSTVPVFENPDEALAYVEKQADHAPWIVDYDVAVTNKPVTHKFRNGNLLRIGELVT